MAHFEVDYTHLKDASSGQNIQRNGSDGTTQVKITEIQNKNIFPY